MRASLPYAVKGQRIGLLGGSFDPPHAGHMHITRQALRRFGLDRVWWVVSPGNPLKKNHPAEFSQRMAACRALACHPRVVVTDLEAHFGTRYTAETVTRLMQIYPGVRFTWLMGADNLGQFHKWENWRGLMESIPIGVLARPGQQVRAGLSPTARMYADFRLPHGRALALPLRPAPCWTLINGPMVDISSTDIRNRGDWGS